METTFDTRDSEVMTHIDHFISRLPHNLRLERVQALTLEDPAAALKMLAEIREALEAERRKVKALLSLAELNETPLAKQIEIERPVLCFIAN